MSLEGKAKTLNELLWENRLEWDKWLRMGVTEQKQIELAPKYQEKWVKLEDAQQEIEKIHRKYETLISKAEKDCADCYQELKQKLQQLLEDMRKIPEKRLPLNQTTWLQEISVWKHQIEELLKEVNGDEM
jgi:ElaB/YqjD/DUF883 family membrane-anchored ribosome-binding protein